MKTQAANLNDEFWPMMQGCHKENSVFKMAHRLVQRKSYIIKVTKKLYEGGKEGMQDKKLVVNYYEVPSQQTMADIINKGQQSDTQDE